MIDPNNLSATAHVTFADDFNSLNLWNGSSGTWGTIPWYASDSSNGFSLPHNGEQEWYINANYAPTASVKPWTVSNGVLTLTAANAAPAIQGLINNYQYTSGEINTYHSFSQTYGYFEMRAQLPAGDGFWPAFWLLPENGSSPPELDAMEVLGNNTKVLYTAVHSMSTGAPTSAGLAIPVPDMSTGFHTYGVDWEPDFITWYFDGKQVYQQPTPPDMNTPMYMLANLAVGGLWVGPTDSTTPFPSGMEIDYIRAYESGAAAGTPPTTPGSPPASGSLTANDTAGQHLTGTSGADVFQAGHNSVVMTGNGGADTFAFQALPWNAGQITDFVPGVDKLDLSALFQASGYNGANPIADGYVVLQPDGAGGTNVLYDTDGAAGGGTILYRITDLDNVSPTGLTWAQLSGTASTGGGGTSGGSLTANDTVGQHLTGTSGADIFQAGHNSVIMTGDGGADTFVFQYLPWNAGQITDFTPGADKLDLSALFQASGYTGANPVADGYVILQADGSGGTEVLYDPDGAAGGGTIRYRITDLDNLSPTGLTWAQLSGGTSSGGGGTTLTANDTAGQHLTGTSGADIFQAGHNSVIMTGNGGADNFVFQYLPWNAGQITDFAPGADKLTLTALFTAANYHGSNPVADGYLQFTPDGAGDTEVFFNPHSAAAPYPILVTTLDHVAPASIHSTDWIFS